MFDIVIIGSGPGGYRAAILATLRKQKVAIIEKNEWGGCCLNRGCVPKKAWHHTANLLHKNNSLQNVGIIGNLSPDFNAAWQHQKTTVLEIRSNYVDYMKRLGIQSFQGHGKLSTDKQVQVIDNNGEIAHTLEYKNLIIATGSTVFAPEHCDISAKRVLTTDNLFDETPPDGNKIAIIGSGVIATEFAYILQQLGMKISWFARSPILNNSMFSDQAISLLTQKLADLKLHCEQNLPVKIEPGDDNVTLHFEDGSLTTVDWLLLAIGRKPNTENLNLKSIEIETDSNGFIQTNQFLATSDPNVYAIGDVRSSNMTANQAIADANIAVENIINPNSRETDDMWVPQSVYSRIELSRIGLDEDTAEDEGFEPATGFASFSASPAAMGQNDKDGFVRLISDMDSGELLGGEIVGPQAGELIHLLCNTENKDTALKKIASLNINHPTRSEELLNATETLASKWGLLDFIYPKKQ